jgi:hypothetical protein
LIASAAKANRESAGKAAIPTMRLLREIILFPPVSGHASGRSARHTDICLLRIQDSAKA